MPRIERTSLVRKVVERGNVAADRIEIRLCRTKVAAALEAGGQNQRPDLDPVVISIEAKLQRSGKGKRLVIENGVGAEISAGLTALIGEAFAIRSQFLGRTTASRQ
jgi:hypothetical protein